MSAIESKGDFLLFRETLTELESLVDVRDSLYCEGHAKKAMAEGITYMLELLIEYDMNTTELNAIEELERLAEMRVKIAQQDRGICDWTELADGQVLDKLINSKIDFVKNISFSRLVSKGGLEPMAALQRLAAVKQKIDSHHIDGLLDDLLVSKIREVVWRPRAKASPKQEDPQCDLPNECEESKTLVKSVSSPLSWLQNQDNILEKDDNSSTIDGVELTPTSTIVSGLPDFTDG